MYTDHPVDRILHIDIQLLVQMIAQGEFLAQRGFEIPLAVISAAAAAAAAAGIRECRLASAGHIDDAVRFVNIFEIRIERRVAVRRYRFGAGQLHGVGSVRRLGRIGLLCWIVFGGGLAIRFALIVGFPFVPLEQRVLFQLGFDERRELDTRQLQQFDRLLQLWRHHQCLGEPKFETRSKCHSVLNTDH